MQRHLSFPSCFTILYRFVPRRPLSLSSSPRQVVWLHAANGAVGGELSKPWPAQDQTEAGEVTIYATVSPLSNIRRHKRAVGIWDQNLHHCRTKGPLEQLAPVSSLGLRGDGQPLEGMWLERAGHVAHGLHHGELPSLSSLRGGAEGGTNGSTGENWRHGLCGSAGAVGCCVREFVRLGTTMVRGWFEEWGLVVAARG